MVVYSERFREGTNRVDVTPVFSDGVTFQHLTDDLLKKCPPDMTKVAGIDALGFIIGAALAVRSGTGFVPIRKGGKLPVPTDHFVVTDYSHTEKKLEIAQGVLTPNDVVVIVDDWMETGAQMRASIALVEGQGARVAGIVLLSAERNEKTEELFEKYTIKALQIHEKK